MSTERILCDLLFQHIYVVTIENSVWHATSTDPEVRIGCVEYHTM
jgi:hypothetical protein